MRILRSGIFSPANRPPRARVSLGKDWTRITATRMDRGWKLVTQLRVHRCGSRANQEVDPGSSLDLARMHRRQLFSRDLIKSRAGSLIIQRANYHVISLVGEIPTAMGYL